MSDLDFPLPQSLPDMFSLSRLNQYLEYSQLFKISCLQILSSVSFLGQFQLIDFFSPHDGPCFSALLFCNFYLDAMHCELCWCWAFLYSHKYSWVLLGDTAGLPGKPLTLPGLVLKLMLDGNISDPVWVLGVVPFNPFRLRLDLFF